MDRKLELLRRASEAVAALFMFLMFATFILQVAVRYGARFPSLTEALPGLSAKNYGWTLEFCLVLWVWIVFWGNAFIVRSGDQVTFDLLFRAVPRGVQRGFLIVSSVAIAAAHIASIAPTWDRFVILRLRRTATLGDLFGDWIRMREIYVVYMIFLVAVSLRALWAVLLALRGTHPELRDERRE
jgi:C4-dicarboxylate transporter DctQ subunit